MTAAANLSVSVPSSQGGLGPFEFFVRQTLVLSGVAAPLATAYALALHAVLLIPMISLGLVSLWVTGISLGDIVRPTTAGQATANEEQYSAMPLGRHQEHLLPDEQVQRGQAQIDLKEEP